MRVGGIRKSSLRPAGPAPHELDQTPSPQGHGSRALVPIAPALARREPPARNAQAAFLAHLIAMNDQVPQTRERRRAGPGEAIAAYRATAALSRGNQ
jgi:hypothetical protein